MRLKLLSAFIALFLVNTLHAQDTKLLFAAHGIYSLPQNDFRNASSYGIGGDASFGIGQRSTMFTGTIGLQSFKGKNSAPNILLGVVSDYVAADPGLLPVHSAENNIFLVVSHSLRNYTALINQRHTYAINDS